MDASAQMTEQQTWGLLSNFPESFLRVCRPGAFGGEKLAPDQTCAG